MDLNLFAPQKPAPAQGQEHGPSLPAAKPSNPGRTSKSFSSVLRAVRQSDDAAAAHQTKTSRAGATTDQETHDAQPRTNERQSTDASAPRTHSADGSSQNDQTAGYLVSEDTSADHQHRAPDQTTVDPSVQGLVLALLQPTASEASTAQPLTTTSSDDGTDMPPRESGEQPQSGTILTLPITAAADHPVMPVATTSAPSPVIQSNTDATQPFEGLFDKAVSGTHTPHQESATDQGHDTDDQPAFSATPPTPAKDDTSAESRPAGPVHTEQTQETPTAGIQLSNLPLDHQVDETLPQTTQIMQTEGPDVLDEQPSPLPPQFLAREVTDKEGSDARVEAPRPHQWQALSDSDTSSGMNRSGDEQPSQDRSDRPFSQGTAATVPPVSDNHTQAASTFAMTAANQALPRGNESQPVTATPLATVAAPHDVADVSIPGSSRSVVFEVAQPDLGRINVRVAMTNDLVHTHFSSDRSDVGQLLMNGQDRLQAALQQSGLDMGQFRVDIDRQSAGRSFQQGASQEQGRTWQQQSGSGQGEHHPSDSQDGGRSRLSGMLNLVA